MRDKRILMLSYETMMIVWLIVIAKRRMKIKKQIKRFRLIQSCIRNESKLIK